MTPLPTHVTWVVGAGGLLGTAVVRALRQRGDGLTMTSRIQWKEATLAQQQLAEGIELLVRTAAEQNCPWRVAWCAGSGVTGTSAETLKIELETLSTFFRHLTQQPGSRDSRVFFASSAGGLYAGSKNPPFTEQHTPTPISDYGRAKLAAEEIVTSFARESGVATVIGRISNLYGPGQNLAKAQGLVSHLCRAHQTGQPVSIYVSLDTVRDYLYVDDCAAMILDAFTLDPPDVGNTAIVKIFAAARGTTIGALIGECRRVFKRSPRIVLGTSANARFQIRDLRLRSTIWPQIDRRALTTLPAGIAMTEATLR